MKPHRTLALLPLILLGLLFSISAQAQSIPERWDVVMRFGFIEVADETLRVSYHDAADIAAVSGRLRDAEIPDNAVIKGSQQRDTGSGLIDLSLLETNGELRMLAVSVVPRQGGGSLALAHWLDPTTKNATARASDYAAELMKSAMAGAKPGDTQTVPAASPDVAAKSAPRPVSGSADVEAILFHLSYKYGAGGAAYPVYTPVVLYSDSRVCRCLYKPIAEIDLANQPAKNLGRWRRNDGDYELKIGDSKKWKRVKATTGKPTALPSIRALRGRYQRISGGGNVALGGSVLAARVKEFDFGADGRFVAGRQSVASSSAGVGGANDSQTGRWALKDHTLTLTYDDGQIENTTVFYSDTRKTSADFGRFGVLWIGGKSYKRSR